MDEKTGEEMNQYRYSPNVDKSILTTKTVKYVVELMNKLVSHVSQTNKKKLRREMHDVKILNRDFRNARKSIGMRGNRDCR